MIDCECKFGAYVPTVPQIYKDAANTEEEDCTSSSLSPNEQMDHSINHQQQCSIGPNWRALKLLSIEKHNHDTSIFEFALKDSNTYLNLPITDHLLIRVKDDQGEYHARPYTALEEHNKGRFKLMIKRYAEWGIPESKQKMENKYFLYAKTDHSYKPPGKVSNYVHSLKIGQTLEFQHGDICKGKIAYPFEENVTSITMIAVGVGVTPMIRILRALLEKNECLHVKKIRLLYGVRTVADILQRSLLDNWHDSYSSRFQVCYCVGSRWNNVTFHAKTEAKIGPPLPKHWESIPDDRKKLGWVDGQAVYQRAASGPSDEGHRVFICGLPQVYMNLCGKRTNELEVGSELHRLGYKDYQVVKF